jgi:hypothetical protein
MRAPAIALACLLLAAAPVAAQEQRRGPVTIPDRWLQGFSRAVSGELLVYPWAYPGRANALLTRTTTGAMRIEWEGEAVPPGMSEERVAYLWHGGLASGYGAHRFSLSINGTPCAAFTSGRDATDAEWTVAGGGGCTLSFKTTRIGAFGELFGFMIATVPRVLVGAAAPRFSVVGEAAGNPDYYMTFQEPVRAWVRATPEEARFRDGARVVSVEVSRPGNPAPMVVRAAGELLWQGTAATGYSTVALAVRATGDLPVVVEIDGAAALSQRVALAPVRSWEIHLLPHSHVDVGYSDPQPEAERKQWRNLREAVELAGKTRGFPPEARFKWNVEGLWSVESYLRQAGEAERRAFVAAVGDGSVDLQANYTNVLTGLSTPEELVRWTDAARRLRDEHGFGPMPTAMHTDIPGLSWTVVRALALGGVRYLSSGPNYMPGTRDGGDRIGRTLEALGDRPFWWQSPSGDERILFWMAGRGYSWFHGMNLGQAEEARRQALLDYLRQLAASGYPYDMVQVRYTIGGDNGPVDARLPDFVKAWNETFETPRLAIDTVRGLFGEFERRYGARLPVYAGDMTPYWEDGAISSAAGERLVRLAARRLQQAEAVFALRGPSAYRPSAFADAWREVTMWHEHTWGAADSVTQPDRPDVVGQWLYKRGFALRADSWAADLMDAALASAAPPRPGAARAFEAINTLSWARDGLVFLEARDTIGKDRVAGDDGLALPSQRLVDGRLAVWLPGVPALGAVRLRPVAGRPLPPASPARVEGTVLDNGRVKVVVDAATGDVRSLRAEAAPGVEFASGGMGLHAYRYVAGLDPGAAVGPTSARLVVEEAGPLVATIRIESAAPGARRLVRRVTVIAGDDRVWLETIVDKTKVREKESGHVAFPFALGAAVVRVDEGEALVTVGRDQLPGSCFDFIGAQGALDVSGDRAGVGIATPDAPLFEIGAITDERRAGGAPRAWRDEPAAGGTVFAYLFNNYWHTNYKADQEGELRFRFVLQPHGAFDAAALRRLGAAVDQPLVVARAAASGPLTPPPFRLEGTPAIVSALRPADDGKGLLVRIYNPTPAPVAATFGRLWKGRAITVLAPGAPRALDGASIELKAFGAATVSIAPDRIPYRGRTRIPRLDTELKFRATDGGADRLP